MSITVFHDTTSAGDAKVVPMSLAQEGLWILDQSQPDGALNTVSVTVHVRQALSIPALAHSLNTLIQRHETLRTTFQMREGQLVQVVSPTLSIPLQVLDLRNLSQAEQEAEAQRLVTSEVQRP